MLDLFQLSGKGCCWVKEGAPKLPLAERARNLQTLFTLAFVWGRCEISLAACFHTLVQEIKIVRFERYGQVLLVMITGPCCLRSMFPRSSIQYGIWVPPSALNQNPVSKAQGAQGEVGFVHCVRALPCSLAVGIRK